jgi:hypothetical protein
MSKDADRISEIYNESFFAYFEHSRQEFYELARILNRHMSDDSAVLDVGCGPAMILEELIELGHSFVTGMDGSVHAKNPKIPAVILCDFRKGIPQNYKYNMVICTEVAEHLDGRFSGLLVKGLVDTSRRDGRIFFTAATPGQGGIDHVNEQPPEYWHELFALHGWYPDMKETDAIRQECGKFKRMTWFVTNSWMYKFKAK